MWGRYYILLYFMLHLIVIYPRFFKNNIKMIDAANAINGRGKPLFDVSKTHMVLKTSTVEPFPDDTQMIVLGNGCFWGTGFYIYNIIYIWLT